MLADRKGLQGALQNGRQRSEKEVSSKEWIVSGEVTFLWGKAGVCQADYLTSADQVTSDWLKVTFLRESETTIRLDVKSWFGDMALAQGTPFWACCLFFNKRM